MSNYEFYHPFGDQCYEMSGQNQPHTYGGHGCGKLDMGGDGIPVYSMADGTVTLNNVYSSPPGCTALCIETNCGAIAPVTMRYLHGNWDQSLQIGTQVKRGQKIGTTSDQGSKAGGPHLHVDISTVANGFTPVQGDLKENNTIFHCDNDNKDYPVDPEVDISKAKSWQSTDGSSKMGYNWLIFASKFEHIEGSEQGVSGGGQGAISGDIATMTSKFNERIKANKGGNFGTVNEKQMQSLVAVANKAIEHGVCRNTAIVLAATARCEALWTTTAWKQGDATNTDANIDGWTHTTNYTGTYYTLWCWNPGGVKQCLNSYVIPSGKYDASITTFPNGKGGLDVQCFMITGICTKKSPVEWKKVPSNLAAANICNSQNFDAYMQQGKFTNVEEWRNATLGWDRYFEINGTSSESYAYKTSPFGCDALNYAWS